jgi:hypothetical protein
LDSIAVLTKEMWKFRSTDRKGLGFAFRKIAGALAAIHTLLTIATDLQKQISSMAAVQVEIALSMEDKDDIKAEASGCQAALDLTMDISQINIFPISEVLRSPCFATYFNTKISEAQEAASIFQWTEMPFTGLPLAENVQIMPSSEASTQGPEIDSVRTSRDFSTILKVPYAASSLLFDAPFISNALEMASNQIRVTFDLEREMVKSIGLSENQDVKTDITDSPFIRSSTKGALSDTIKPERPQFAVENIAFNAAMLSSEASTQGPEIDSVRTSRDFSAIFTVLHAASSFLFDAPIISNALENASDQILVTFDLEREMVKSMSQNEYEAGKTDIGGPPFILSSAKGALRDTIKPERAHQRVIEIPVFMPNSKAQSLAEDIAVNAAMLSSEASTQGPEIDSVRTSRDLSTILAAPHAASSLRFGAPLISSLLENASDQISVTFDLEREMVKSMGQDEYEAGKTDITIRSSTGSALIGTILPEGITLEGGIETLPERYGPGVISTLKNISAKGWKDLAMEDLANNIDFSLAIAAATQKDGHSAVKDLAMTVPSHSGGLYEMTVTPAPHVMPSLRQDVSLLKDAATQTQIGGNVAHFHNTFNIVVNVKGRTETEIKDLGKKIGLILSDEMRQYGGIS